MNLKSKLALLLVMLMNISLFAQESYSIKGTVTSKADNSPLPGVSIVIKNTTTGTSSDFDGNYTIGVKKGDALTFSFLGYVSQTITITNQKTLNVTLLEESNVLDEVVVVGYGAQKKSHLTGAISKVKNEKLDQIAVSRVDDALVGQVSGVNIQATNGEAGSAPTIRIRGTGSITGDSSPLVVVDGVVVDSDFLGSLDMNDVDSFEILKDAASAAIYGSRGGNGVIIISTKTGKEGKTIYNFSSYTGFKTARQSDAYYSTVAQTVKAELAANGVLSDRTKYKQLIGVDNNWQNIIFNGGAIINNSFSARGGNKKVKFSTALNYLHDEGVLLTDDYKKYSLKLQADYKINNKLTIGTSVSPSYSNQRRFDGSTHDILRQPSWLPLYLDANTIRYVNRFREGGAFANAKIGDYAQQRMFDDYDLVNGAPSTGSGTDISNTSNTNPGAKVLERNRSEFRHKIFGNLYVKYKLADGLNFKTSFSGDYQQKRTSRYQGILSSRNGASASSLDSTMQKSFHLASDNILTYSKIIDKHEINAVFGFSAERTKVNFESIQGSVFADDSSPFIKSAASITDQQQYEYVNTLISYFTRVNYAYDDKYLASISLRRDGSSVFGPNTKYGNFMAASAGWNLDKEEFLVDNQYINKLKLRVSYGVTGNNAFRTGNPLVDNYPYLAILDNTKTGVSGGNSALVVNPLNIANPDLTWERQIEFNPGIDFVFFSNRISGSIDYYTRTSDQLLLYNPISSTTGFTNALVNLGEVENKGIEVELRTKNLSLNGFKWSSTFIASKNKNTLTNFADSNGQIQNVDSKRASEWINLEGNPISSFYGWVVDKEIPLEFLSDPFHPIGAQAQDVYVRDLNGDGLIDDDDKTILGNPYPDLVWSFTNDFKINNFDISFMFQGSHGAKVRNMGDQYIFNHFNSAQDFISTTPNQGFIKEKIFTNAIIQDASYIALRNVNIGYNFNQNILSKIKLTKARLYLSGQNLMYLTADGYTGFNPESVDDTSSTTYGYQRAGSPIFSTVSMGVNIEF